MTSRLFRLGGVAGAALIATSLPAAEGNRLLGSSVAQLATTGAGAASPWDSAWLANNVAGLTRVPHRVDGTLEIIYAETSLLPEGPIANPSAGRLEDETWVLAPHLTYARPLANDAGVVALGVYTVSGLEAVFDESRSIPGALGDYDTFARGSTARASAGYAHAFGGGWSLGLALNLNYGQLEADLMTADGSQTEAEGELDTALGFGFQLAVQKDFEAVSIALAYTSRQWMQSFDAYNDLLAGPIDQPQVLQLGLAWRATPTLELLADYRFVGWSSVTALGDEDDGFGWEDQHVFKLAARWRLHEGLAVHGGLSYGNSPIRDEDAFVNAFSMLNSEWHLGLGATWLVTERLELGAALVHAPENSNTDDGSRVMGLGEGTEITLEMTSLTLGAGYLF